VQHQHHLLFKCIMEEQDKERGAHGKTDRFD